MSQISNLISREKVETLLRINGVPPAAPEEEIRSILLSARFNNDEVDAAIMVLRENTETKQSRVQGMHKILRSDTSLNPAEISSLLGIDVTLKEIAQDRKKIRTLSHTQFLLIIIVAITLALTSLTFIMYTTQVGIFHPSMQRNSSSV